MVSDDKRIRIITGHYGSGKTEFAVNYVTELRKQTDRKVALADLDIVNVYFRSREKKKELEEQGIYVIASSLEGAGLDVPAVSAALTTPVRDKGCEYVIDLGGNDVGTMVLGRITPILDRSEVDFFMVVNTYRPNTSTPEGVIEQMESLEYASGLKVTGFINNTNLIRETTAGCLTDGDAVLREVTKRTGVPVKYVSYVEELLTEEVPGGLAGELFPMKFYMRKTWM
ncbi:ATP-binding protein [Anaerotignum lactatifermentans]|uniref:ATP-binding protein n=1 Tax=Anaerotignum lactatifermentans TaxID=160404 RepID=A0ABS2G7T5_9FIRM|nr:ATP-binding protein [Anaerotignum lactatifermentans]MBM6828214.1 ATP-binding protein [Anaerotignum lactatifermentans]MBM6876623.1 ATP-binding protein [Anaerotignum lactatifermentans]MBM6949797.1 ATP-binding protein [Anaerotignum lactatifermentans]